MSFKLQQIHVSDVCMPPDLEAPYRFINITLRCDLDRVESLFEAYEEKHVVKDLEEPLRKIVKTLLTESPPESASLPKYNIAFEHMRKDEGFGWYEMKVKNE